MTPSKYFNQRLLHYTQKFASDNDYIFFAHTVLQKLQLSSHYSKILNRVQDFIAKDKAFSFMSSIKGTPVYWEKNLHQGLTTAKKLGTLTLFLTLSCADLRWNNLISIMFELNHVDISDEELH